MRALLPGPLGKKLERLGDKVDEKLAKWKGEREEKELVKRAREKQSAQIDKVSEELFGGGLMGKLAGGLFKSAFNTLSEAAAEATKGVKEAYDEAAFAVENSDAVRDALGAPVQCSPPMQQSSSSSNINGVQTQNVGLGFVAQGARGQAQVRAIYTTAGDGSEPKLDVKVVLPTGRVIDSRARHALVARAAAAVAARNGPLRVMAQ
eukprot:PRCOL_00005677-RA